MEKTKVRVAGGYDNDGEEGYIDGYFTEPTNENQQPSVWAIVVIGMKIDYYEIEELEVV